MQVAVYRSHPIGGDMLKENEGIFRLSEGELSEEPCEVIVPSRMENGDKDSHFSLTMLSRTDN
jgi:hypothetical protein